MANGEGRHLLLARMKFDDSGFWQILVELVEMAEDDRRRVLRNHIDAGIEGYELILKRRRLDLVLEAITLFEVGRELSIVQQSDFASAPQAEFNKLCMESEAFLHYCNTYLYFAVRFYSPLVSGAPAVTNPPSDCPQSKPPAFPLLRPPDLPLSPVGEQAMAALLRLTPSDAIYEALDFLDGIVRPNETPDVFEAWLLGIRPETPTAVAAHFSVIAEGMVEWAVGRLQFYRSLDPGKAATETNQETEGVITGSLAARFGLNDFYWLARLLRADVTARASVTYEPHSWLELLGFQAALYGDKERQALLLGLEKTLRSVFDFTCDLIQNGIEVTEEAELKKAEPDLFHSLPRYNAGWREVFDEELAEIEVHRERRSYVAHGTPPPPQSGPASKGPYWSQAIREGHRTCDLIGLAFSGGGIRSATFNLGVLQALQQFDLLRRVDYLSTVSGGGFIGSWLVANVYRKTRWLARLTNWDESLAHLRRYSKYLSPETGILSADTWTMLGIWVRNAFLIQLTSITWLGVILTAALLLRTAFDSAGDHVPIYQTIAALAIVLITAVLLYNLAAGRERQIKDCADPPWIVTLTSALSVVFGARRKQAIRVWLVSVYRTAKPGFDATWIQRLAVLPTWVASFCCASLLWYDAVMVPAGTLDHYSDIVLWAWRTWWILFSFVALGLFLIAVATVRQFSKGTRSFRDWFRALLRPLWITAISLVALYLETCAIFYLFHKLANQSGEYAWYAYVFGPWLVLGANTVSIVLFIGFCGRHSAEWTREWWTRFGAWLGIYGIGYLAASVAAVFGPLWILLLLNVPLAAKGAFLGWVGSVVTGLMSANSSKTTGDASTSKVPWLEYLAQLAGVLFIAGAVLGASTILYATLVAAGTEASINAGNYWIALNLIPQNILWLTFGSAVILGWIFSASFDINIFGLNRFYRNRIVRCYLGATRSAPGLRHPQPFTAFDGCDDLLLGDLRASRGDFRGPFPIINSSLNLGGSSDLSLHTRHSASFSMTPLRCGSDRRKVGFIPTGDATSKHKFAGGLRLGQAVAISGAAVSPNMGYSTSPLVAFLLTLFNVRLGWWFPNPGRKKYKLRGPRLGLSYLILELFGLAGETSDFVNVSDGGHFENLGIYELVRRRCKVIIASDGECDEFLRFGSLGNLVRICETDFGAKIDIDVSSIRQQKDGESFAHCTVGRITYSNGSIGYLVYLKASITGDEDVGVTQYRATHPTFPHESTANQFFTEDQFESYRRLGNHVVEHALRGTDLYAASRPIELAEKLFNQWAPAGFSNGTFLKHTQALDGIWERFRNSKELDAFFTELTARPPLTFPSSLSREEKCAGLELIQLMENVFLDLRLDDFWDHPDNRGWTNLFMDWARSPRFRMIWNESKQTYGVRFGYFCHQRLGLSLNS
jgi:Patatin-like phospholipase